MLSEEGSGGISIDEVSRRSGGDVIALATGLAQQLKSVRWAPRFFVRTERERRAFRSAKARQHQDALAAGLDCDFVQFVPEYSETFRTRSLAPRM